MQTINYNLVRLNPFRWPYSLSELLNDESEQSFSYTPSAVDLAFYDVFFVEETATPSYDPRTERIDESTPEPDAEGVYRQQWEIRPATEDETAAYDAANLPQPQWTAFGSVVMEQAEIKALLNQAFAIGESPLAMGLAVGLGKAADGDSSVFLDAWGKALARGLVQAELIAQVQALAGAYDLPAEFIAGLQGVP